MNTWTPIEEHQLLDLINKSWLRMSLPQRRLWDVIKIEPKKWQLDPWGNLGNGFWVVAVYGEHAVWFNDIEDGFNRSHISEFGKLEDYFCNQDQLEWTIQHILDQIKDGSPSGGHFGAPEPIT
tara:strand:- start:62 stop:430 length:369 start_codon:yes stop_codon:yes gene_type:complete